MWTLELRKKQARSMRKMWRRKAKEKADGKVVKQDVRKGKPQDWHAGDKVIDLLQQTGEKMTSRQIAKELEKDLAQVQAILVHYVQKGLILKEKNTNRKNGQDSIYIYYTNPPEQKPQEKTDVISNEEIKEQFATIAETVAPQEQESEQQPQEVMP